MLNYVENNVELTTDFLPEYNEIPDYRFSITPKNKGLAENQNSQFNSYHQTFTMETNEELLEKKYTILTCEVYKEYLSNTDHKFLNGYKPKEGEDIVEIERLRDEARDFIRANR